LLNVAPHLRGLSEEDVALVSGSAAVIIAGAVEVDAVLMPDLPGCYSYLVEQLSACKLQDVPFDTTTRNHLP
jgi:hypothetical protein